MTTTHTAVQLLLYIIQFCAVVDVFSKNYLPVKAYRHAMLYRFRTFVFFPVQSCFAEILQLHVKKLIEERQALIQNGRTCRQVPLHTVADQT